MADWHKQGGASPELERNQRHQKENFERNLPAMIRDGKDIAVSFTGGNAITIPHGLGRRPRGWFIHSAGRPNSAGETAGSSPYAIIEVFSNESEIRLINNYGGAGNLTAALWIW